MAKEIPEPIAIIGSGCRFPGEASSPSKLWELLQNPRDVLRKIDRFNTDGFYHKDGHHHGATNVTHAHLLSEDFKLFDPGFFGINPVEAESIDPLQRLLLETVYEGIENAGLPMEKLAGSDTAFYAGVMASDYTDILMRDPDTIPQYFATATARSIISNRVSYVFDWHGPSMTIDTACSSSFMALHSAVQSLRMGESGIAVAAGGNLILGPELFIALSKLNMASSKGRSAMWDADVDGYGRGEGFVAVVLKRLSDAIRDGDHIDCVIRNTGANQDGRTKGITMPSAALQAELIRKTYAHAGLNARNSNDQPQYFEAHGTGTQVGDPKEAEAIHSAFFGADFDQSKQEIPLYVGGIKTIVGHTEGTAGLAGLLKASLSLQAGIIPPNRLFNNLNPEIAPFNGPLKLVTEGAIPWPALADGVPRRASVNSFGFGGANVHAILEAYTPPEHKHKESYRTETIALIPFVFSANSESALQRTLSRYRDFLTENLETNLLDLNWTLRARRSALPVKIAISAGSVDELISAIDQRLQMTQNIPSEMLGTRSVSGRQKILGIFTGQGAQWAKMGRELIDTLPRAKKMATEFDRTLQNLPEAHRPSWNIVEELSKDAKSSRLQEAMFSQPLCTVVQVILVDILKAAGIRFSAVVGHSSGEIGAAYAAGFLSAPDAVTIAYYRGFYAKLAKGRDGERGAMMAVGTSMDGAKELCNLSQFKGRISLAASNSSSSVTLSGDENAINQAKVILDEDKTFARLLKVDTAYHSHHMQSAADPYVQALQDAGITAKSSSGDCIWYSSVLDGRRMDPTDATLDRSLGGEYWRDNMVNAVLFSQAITGAIRRSGPFSAVLEVGPHPALKGPASQTLSELGVDIPYFGTLQRGNGDHGSISACFGVIWTTLGASAIDFDGVQSQLYGDDTPPPTPKVIKNLPSYSWDHDKPYWYESRRSRLLRSRAEPSHELLGVRCDEGDEHELRWRNFLSIQEIPWLEGHQIQGQTVYPAAGYVSMAIEAGQIMASGDDIHLVEIEDLVIHKAIVFYDEKTGVETITTLSNITTHNDSNDAKLSITADFTISAHLSRDQVALTKAASGKIRVVVNESSCVPALPSRGPTPPHLLDIDIDRFYSSLASIGYGYTDRFQAFSEMKRRLNYTTGIIEQPATKVSEKSLLVHPGLLDHAFQALFGAFSWPGDGRFWSLFLPTSVKKVTIDTSLYRELKRKSLSTERLAFDAWLVDSPSREMRGDVVFSTPNEAESSAVIQVEGASMVSFFESPARDDRAMFFETEWGVSMPDGKLAVGRERATKEDLELAEACERIACYYWRRLEDTLTPFDRQNCSDHHKHLLDAITHFLDQGTDGKKSKMKKEWYNDSDEIISALIEKYPAAVDIRLCACVGRALPAVIRKEASMLDCMQSDGMLDEFHSNSLGLSATNRYLERVVKQIAHRYPRMNLIEIGAGTGSSTAAVLSGLDGAYSSYTFTDISRAHFENAATRFVHEADKLFFKTLDIRSSPVDQGYIANSYDLIIACNVLHTTSDLEDTLKNARSLLKPGGFLLLQEITDNTSLRYTFTMGGLPEWWLGVGDGRRYSPCIAPSKWNQALRKAGFAGVDTITPSLNPYSHPFSVIAAQAIDNRIEQLRRPLLQSAAHDREWNPIYVLGGQDLDTSNLIEEVLAALGDRFDETINVLTLEDVLDTNLAPNATVISFLDLDGPVFQDLTSNQLKSLQLLVETTHNLLWVTHAQEEQNPYSNATVGFFRTVSAELPTLRAQVLDFHITERPQCHARVISEALLRLDMTDTWEQDPEFKKQLLWTTEPELRFQDGKLWVPRVKPHKSNNERLNGQRRTITQSSGHNNMISLSRKEDSWHLQQHYVPKALPTDLPGETAAIRVRYSTLWTPILDNNGLCLQLVIGQLVGSDQWVVSLAHESSSEITVNSAWTITISDFTEEPLIWIAALLAEVLADRIADLAKGCDNLILVYDPEPLLASSLLRKSQAQDFRVKFLTGDSTRVGGDWIHLHTRQSVRAARSLIPQDASAFVDLGPSGQRWLMDLTVASVPSTCRIFTGENFVLHHQPTAYRKFPHNANGFNLASLVKKSHNLLAEMDTVREFAHHHLMSLEELQEKSKHADPLALVDWKVEGSLGLQIAQPRPQKLFKKEHSYMLVGMTAEMGKSLCRWMVESGAGAVIMTSRNPKIDHAWIEELESTGAKIKIGAFDATNRQSWITFKSEISRECPPLAGIINGAVVLQDQMFLDMDIDGFNKTLAPKIDSTTHLDEIFRDDILDFFIVLSSLSSIIGNRGQANYNAANAFTTSLVKQRLSRGQAASVIQLGSVVGVGFLTRAGEVMETLLIKYGYLPVSEVDLHYFISQAIMAGLPNSGENPDLITGLRYAREYEENTLHWATNPRFSHMILPPEKQNEISGEKKVAISTRAQLAAATTHQEAVKVMEICFANKIMAVLQISEDSFRPDAALVELGVDSLVAVEIRSWFLNEISTDMAVLKILGGASTSDIAVFAVEQMPKKLLSGIGTDGPVAKTKPETGESSTAKITPEEHPKNEIIQTPSTETTSTPRSPLALSQATIRESPASSVTDGDIKPQPEVLRRVRISSAQSRFWFLNMILADKTVSNVTFSYNIQGRLHVADMFKAVKTVAQNHEALRTCFIPDEESTEIAWQGLMRTSKLELKTQHIRTDEEIKAQYVKVRYTTYDLAKGDTMQIILLSKDTMTHTIIFGYHHILMDGVGFEAFLADLERAYNKRRVTPQGLQYLAFSEAEEQRNKPGSREEKLTFWKKEFEEIPTILPLLPVSKVTSRKVVDRYGSSYVERRLDVKMSADIKAICQKLHVTPSHFYLTTFRVMLMRLTGVTDICIGLADANRHDSDVMSTVGLFLNILPIYFKNSANDTFDEVLKETRTKVYEALGHAGVPFDELLQALRLPRSSSHSPLFQAFFDYHQGAQERLKFGNMTWEVADRNPGETAYDITLDVIEGTAGSLVALIGQDYLYGVDEMEKLLDTYLTLLEEFVSDKSVSTSTVRLYGQKRIDDALSLSKGPSLNFEWGPTLGHRVQEICSLFPDAVALTNGDSISLTYRSIEAKAFSIRNQLLTAGVKQGDTVAVFQDSTPDWIVSVISIFWAGAVYVPLVRINPMPRLAAIVVAAKPKVILADDSTASLAQELQLPNSSIINVSNSAPKGELGDRTIYASAEDPALILFTSGSTGIPKGIVLRHRNLANHIEGYVRAWDIGREIVLQQSAFSFDLSIGQIFTGLSMGGTVVVVPEKTRGDPVTLAKLILENGITWTLLTPSEYSGVLESSAEDLRKATSWNHALACGEALTRKLVREFKKLDHKKLRLYNAYGPVEAIISATMAEIPLHTDGEDGPVTIGVPNPNYSIYIIDEQCNILPQGFPGEILIGGCGVAAGYLNNEELTEEKFLLNKFESSADWDNGWNMSYRTGDMGRLRKDGTFMYEGRREGDSQVKIRGFRVDLLDIETTLLNASHGVLYDAVITMRPETQILIARVMFERAQQPQDTASYLAKLLADLPLPPYMIPNIAIPVGSFPKNLHGKKDRSAIARLPLPQTLTTSSNDSAELSSMEERLAETWREILPAEFSDLFSIESSTDFFTVGGNSLLLVKLQSCIRDAFDVSIPLLELFDISSLSKMAVRIKASRVVSLIDWDEETAITRGTVEIANSAPNTDENKTGKIVLFTGATGYFGPYLLADLISNPAIQTIHCVAIRADNLSHAKSRVPLSSSPKVVVHVGDLSLPRLGLTQNMVNYLTANVDLVIHSGARRSFWDSYYELRGTNVLSSKELVAIAAPRKVPIQFMSTSGVLLLDESIDGELEASVQSFQPPNTGEEGYVASKWASEVLLENAGTELGIPVTIHRFTPRSKPNEDETNLAALEALIGSTTKLGAIPERSTWAGRFDVINTGNLAQRIISGAVDGLPTKDAEVEFKHHPSEAALTPTELFDFLESRLGDKIGGRMGMLEWVGGIKKCGYEWLFSTHDLELAKEENGVVTKLINRR